MSDNLFASHPDARRAVEAATGLEGGDLDRVIDGLADAGLAPTLRPNADSDARYSHAVSLIRAHAHSPRAAALEAGIDPSNFYKRLKLMNEKIPDAETLHRAAEERILTRAEELSEMAAEKLIADVEADRLKPADLVKTYTAATTQVAAKRRWSQGLGTVDDGSRNALADALGKLRDGYKVSIEKPDPANTAIDITPSDEDGDTKESKNASR